MARNGMVEPTSDGRVLTEPAYLRAFVTESNRIEGIGRRPWKSEIVAHEHFLASPSLTTEAVEVFVSSIAPGHRLRRHEGANVRVGRHAAPRGGPEIIGRLAALCKQANAGADPYDVHCRYEYLHPFTDGNGRSGRALWLWMMLRQGRGSPWFWMAREDRAGLHLTFLHAFYYQTLDALDAPSPTPHTRPDDKSEEVE